MSQQLKFLFLCGCSESSWKHQNKTNAPPTPTFNTDSSCSRSNTQAFSQLCSFGSFFIKCGEARSFFLWAHLSIYDSSTGWGIICLLALVCISLCLSGRLNTWKSSEENNKTSSANTDTWDTRLQHHQESHLRVVWNHVKLGLCVLSKQGQLGKQMEEVL